MSHLLEIPRKDLLLRGNFREVQFCHGRIQHRQQSAREEPQRTHGQCNVISTSPFPLPFLRSHLSYLKSINGLSMVSVFFSLEFYNSLKQSTHIESPRSCWTPRMTGSCHSYSFPVEGCHWYLLTIKLCSMPYWFFSHTIEVKCDHQCGSGLFSCLVCEH